MNISRIAHSTQSGSKAGCTRAEKEPTNTSVNQIDDVLVIRDLDGQPSLRAEVQMGQYFDPPQLVVRNSDSKEPVANLELSAMGDHEALQMRGKNLIGGGVSELAIQRTDQGLSLQTDQEKGSYLLSDSGTWISL